MHAKYLEFIAAAGKSIPAHIANEEDQIIRTLHEIYDIEAIVAELSAPMIAEDYSRNRDQIAQSRKLIGERPSLDRPEYLQLINGVRKLSMEKLIALYTQYGYGEVLLVIQEKYNIKQILGLEKKEQTCTRRFWRNAEPHSALVYDPKIMHQRFNKNSGVTEEYIEDARSIKMEREADIKRDLVRQTSDFVYPDIIGAYNRELEKKIIAGLRKCVSVHVKQPIDLTQTLISSFNFYKYTLCDSIEQIQETVLLDTREYMSEALYGLNPHISNKRELFYGNANIIFDILKNIKANMKLIAISLNFRLPASTRDDKLELSGKIKYMVTRAVEESGIKMQRRGVEQQLCL